MLIGPAARIETLPLRNALGGLLLATAGVIALPATASAQTLPVAEDDAAMASAPIIVTGHLDGYAVDETATATKTNTALIDVPQSIAIITREQLDDQAIHQLGDALRFVPGITLAQGEGHRDQVTIRGQSSTADFFVDGLRDDAQYYRALYNAERLEVLRGANAMIFGRGGGGGVINRVSKQPTLGRGGLSGEISADSWGAFSLAGDAKFDLTDGFAGRVNAIYEQHDNHRDGYDGRSFGVNPVVAGNIAEHTRLLLSYEFADDDRAVDRGVPSLAGRPVAGNSRSFFGKSGFNRGTITAHIARARLEHDITDQLRTDVTLHFADYDKRYSNVFPRAATATTVELEGYSDGAKRQSITGQANLIWQGETGTVRHTLLLGAEAADQDSTSERSTALFAGGTSGGTRFTVPLQRGSAIPAVSLSPLIRSNQSDASVLSAYAKDQIAIGSHLQIIAGQRFDRFRLATLNLLNNAIASRTDEKFSPRIGAIVKPAENISLYGSYSISFLPQSGDQFLTLDATTASLAPERFRNLEAGVKFDIRPDLAFTAAVWRLDRTNTRAVDPLNPTRSVLTGSTRAKGFEAQLAGNVTAQWQLSAGYALQDGEIRSTTTAAPAGRKLAQLPRHQFSLWSRYDVTQQFGVALGVTHQSRMFAAISNAVTLPAFSRVDAALFWKPSEKVQIQANVENLLDKRYFASAHSDQNIATGEPISARLTLRLAF